MKRSSNRNEKTTHGVSQNKKKKGCETIFQNCYVMLKVYNSVKSIDLSDCYRI